MTPSVKLEAAEARGRFAAEVAKADAELQLARATLLVGKEEEPRACDVGRCLARLDEMGEEARARVVRGDAPAVEALNRYLFDEQGFAGNAAEYYDPRNSMLHRVLERRLGIPITLSVVYMEVGRRAGLRVEGVGLPGHFIVRAYESDDASDDNEGTLVDPFNRKVTDFEECRQRVDGIYEGMMSLNEGHLHA